MKAIWSWGIIAALVLAVGAGVAAQQQQQQAKTKTTEKKVVKQEAKGEEDEKDEQDEKGEKKYTIAVQLPPAITAAFKKAYPAATIRGTAKETNKDGQTEYEVESLDKGLARDLMYKPDGTVISVEEAMNAADLPAPVMAAFKKLYPKASITLAEKVTEGGKTTYDLQLKGADKTEVSFNPDGTLVPPETPAAKK